MKGIIFEIRRFTVHDGPGIRTTVFMKGCPLSCWWCHNPEGQNPQPEPWTRLEKLEGRVFEKQMVIGQEWTTTDLMTELLKDRVFYEESDGGVTFSGGEPLMQPAFLKEMLALCRQHGIHTAVDTSGFAPREILMEIAAISDLFLYDLKVFDEALHVKYTGVSNRIIFENLHLLLDAGKPVWLRHPVIPGINDSEDEKEKLKHLLSQIAGSIAALHLLPYHSIARNKYRKSGKTNRLESLNDLAESDLYPMAKELEETGVKVVIGG